MMALEKRGDGPSEPLCIGIVPNAAFGGEGNGVHRADGLGCGRKAIQ